MIDTAKISVKAGNGGNGCNSFRGIKFTRSRRADGGRGGPGADLIIKADAGITSLEKFRYNQHFKADNGRQGEANNKKGAEGRPCIIKVPPGTIVRDLDNNTVLRDLLNPGEELLVTKGGAGGKGNAGIKQATSGSLGEEKRLHLELKLIADIALIGFPNTGKSTLLSSLTSAHPKIAHYPFTTTSPVIGVLSFADFEEPHTLKVVEIPALTSGAHQGKGLGANFLRHAERVKLLIYVLDVSDEQKDPWDDLAQLRQELKIAHAEFCEKKELVVANKLDLAFAKNNYEALREKVKVPLLPASALNATGVEELKVSIKNMFKSV